MVAPPFIATLIALPVARLLRARVAVDIHSGAILDRRWRWSLPILRRIVAAADAGVVTLESLASELGCTNAIVLPDPLPDLGDGTLEQDRSGQPTVVAICGWGDDEDVDVLTRSAFNRPWHLVLTGRPRRNLTLPKNVHLAGFLPDAEYVNLLRKASVIIVMTNRDETLLSGAWEAIALGQPLLVSATPTLTSVFGIRIACLSTDPVQIGDAIQNVLADPVTAADESARLRTHFAAENRLSLLTLADSLAINLEQRPNVTQADR